MIGTIHLSVAAIVGIVSPGSFLRRRLPLGLDRLEVLFDDEGDVQDTRAVAIECEEPTSSKRRDDAVKV